VLGVAGLDDPGDRPAVAVHHPPTAQAHHRERPPVRRPAQRVARPRRACPTIRRPR
jgi:hypothetical protein